MSGQSKKTGRRVNSQKKLNQHLGDVSLNDFANCSISPGKGRMKKGATNSIVKEVKHLSLQEDDKHWYEKLDEFEGAFELVEEENEDGTKVVVKRNARRSKKSTSENSEDQSGIEYPLDMWFLISEHIFPEDVSTFARICKSSFHVVTTAKFWFCLYKRFYKSVPNMPDLLQPECMMRLYSLRSSVIRALHYMYPPFIEKFKATPAFEIDSEKLKKRVCILLWHQKIKNQWLFHFKFKHAVVKLGRGSGESKQPDLLEMLEDVSANPEEGCKVLQVVCAHYIPLPMVQGMMLCTVKLNLSQGMRHYRLHLTFGSGPLCYPDPKSTVILDPVVNVRVLDWWHPQYPHITSGFYFHNEEPE